jgi:hypothetical protein
VGAAVVAVAGVAGERAGKNGERKRKTCLLLFLGAARGCSVLMKKVKKPRSENLSSLFISDALIACSLPSTDTCMTTDDDDVDTHMQHARIIMLLPTPPPPS